MGTYANIKFSKFQRGILRWLSTKQNIRIEKGGKHTIKIRYAFGQRPFPIPKVGNEIDKHIIAQLQKKLEEWEVCTKEEFDERL